MEAVRTDEEFRAMRARMGDEPFVVFLTEERMARTMGVAPRARTLEETLGSRVPFFELFRENAPETMSELEAFPPCLLFFRGGKEVYRQTHAYSEEEFDQVARYVLFGER